MRFPDTNGAELSAQSISLQETDASKKNHKKLHQLPASYFSCMYQTKRLHLHQGLWLLVYFQE